MLLGASRELMVIFLSRPLCSPEALNGEKCYVWASWSVVRAKVKMVSEGQEGRRESWKDWGAVRKLLLARS